MSCDACRGPGASSSSSSACPRCGGNPRITPPEPPPFDPGPCSLAERLAATVNRVRGQMTELGLRPYRVFSIERHWTGGQVGRGDVSEVLAREFLPRPKVEFRTRREPGPAGWVERGVVVVSEINPQLTEDEVLDLVHVVRMGEAKPGDERFLEITMDARDGASERRRFVMVEPPVRQGFGWRVVLRQQDSGRSRAGASPYPGR